VDLDVVAGIGDHDEPLADLVEQTAGQLGATRTARQQNYGGAHYAAV
jgi:hypothetical protein